jgi:hypothetical protein
MRCSFPVLIAVLLSWLMSPGCGGGSSSSSSSLSAGVVSVLVIPIQPVVKAGSLESFQAVVRGTANHGVIWKVNGTQGGDPATGLTVGAAGI